MRWTTRYLVSLLPLGVVGGGILISEWIFKTFNCATHGKEFVPCFAFGFDITSIVVIGMFWFKYLLPVAWFISVAWFVYVVISHAGFILNRRRT
jgi:hypothetical protein